MKTIIITGPSGSGKTILSKKLSKLFEDTIVIKTDSYYSDSLIIKLLSIFKFDIYDRPISLKRKELIKALKSINNGSLVINSYKYDFKKKKSLNSKIKLNYKGKNQFLILEGIFAHRLDLNYHDTINIVCIEDKDICFKRRLERDQIKRGRKGKEVFKKFNRSWYLFYNNIKKYLNIYKVIKLNPVDKFSYNKLIFNLKQLSHNN